MANETTDWIAIVISLASAGFAVIAFFVSRRAQNKVQLYEQERHLTAETREFLYNTLRSREFLDARDHLYKHYCSKRFDTQALANDDEYRKAARDVHETFLNITFDFDKRKNFIEVVDKGEWIAIIKCDKILTDTHAFDRGPREKLVNTAIEQLKKQNVNIDDIDPCKK